MLAKYTAALETYITEKLGIHLDDTQREKLPEIIQTYQESLFETGQQVADERGATLAMAFSPGADMVRLLGDLVDAGIIGTEHIQVAAERVGEGVIETFSIGIGAATEAVGFSLGTLSSADFLKTLEALPDDHKKLLLVMFYRKLSIISRMTGWLSEKILAVAVAPVGAAAGLPSALQMRNLARMDVVAEQFARMGAMFESVDPAVADYARGLRTAVTEAQAKALVLDAYQRDILPQGSTITGAQVRSFQERLRDMK